MRKALTILPLLLFVILVQYAKPQNLTEEQKAHYGYTLEIGEYDFPIDSRYWTSFNLPGGTPTSITSAAVIRIIDDGREYQKLPAPKEFHLSKSKTITTSVLEVIDGKLTPVQDFGPRGYFAIRIRAEHGKASVHFSTVGTKGQQQAAAIKKWMGDNPLVKALGGLLACIGGPIIIFYLFKFLSSVTKERLERSQRIDEMAEAIKRSRKYR